MSKFKSRKLIVSGVSLGSAVAVSYSTLDPNIITQFYDFLGTLVTFYLLGQGAVDTVGKMKGFKD